MHLEHGHDRRPALCNAIITHPRALQFHSRTARLLYLPAYVARYVYGTRYKQGTSGVIVPQIFSALIGGTRDGEAMGGGCTGL
jgi:hypothetical protein